MTAEERLNSLESAISMATKGVRLDTRLGHRDRAYNIIAEMRRDVLADYQPPRWVRYLACFMAGAVLALLILLLESF